MRWFALWIAAVVATALGVLLLYLEPGLLVLGKGADPALRLVGGYLPVAFIVAGIIGIVAGAAGIWHARRREGAGAAAVGATGRRGSVMVMSGRVPDTLALVALVVAGAALLAWIFVFFLWPVIASTMGAGPCGQNPTAACMSAHSDYYKQLSPGDGFSTPQSRIYHVVLTPVLLTDWPLALAAAVVGWLALALGTQRRRQATLGLAFGSLTVVGTAIPSILQVIGGGD